VLKHYLIEEGIKEQRFIIKARAYSLWKGLRPRYAARRIFLAIK
jgi:hypothetical protein